MQQHVGDARHRNEVGDAVASLREVGHGHGVVAAPVIGDRTQRIAIAAAGQADLPEHARQHDAHPDRLLAMLGALQRMRDHDERAFAGRRRANATIASAGTPVMAAAQAAFFGWPSVSPRR